METDRSASLRALMKEKKRKSYTDDAKEKIKHLKSQRLKQADPKQDTRPIETLNLDVSPSEPTKNGTAGNSNTIVEQKSSGVLPAGFFDDPFEGGLLH